jgi:hypothetical protein
MNAWVNYRMTNLSSVGKFMKGTLSEIVEELIEKETHSPTGKFVSMIEVKWRKDNV